MKSSQSAVVFGAAIVISVLAIRSALQPPKPEESDSFPGIAGRPESPEPRASEEAEVSSPPRTAGAEPAVASVGRAVPDRAPAAVSDPALARKNLVPVAQVSEKAGPNAAPDTKMPSYVLQARRDGAPRVHVENDDYLFLPNIEVIHVGMGESAEAKIRELRQSGREIVGRRSGMLFVRREGAVSNEGFPQAAYNERSGQLALVTGTYKVRTAEAGAGHEILQAFAHLSLVAEFSHLRLTLLQSRDGDRLFADLEALRKRPGVVSAELEVLEHEVAGI